jgi:cation-transporting ATPase 13A3/4/5
MKPPCPCPGLLDCFVPAVIVLQLIALASLHRVPWYTPTTGTTDLRTYVAPETSVIYLTNLAQFVILAVVFNKGHPHR